MRTVSTWLKRGVVGVYAVVAGVIGAAGALIVARRDMYGDDPRNDPYSIEYDPTKRR